jgi:hypothetical protein
MGDKIRLKLPDANKMEGRRYRRIYEGKLDQMLIYAVQNKGWDSMCVHDRRGRVDATMTHLLTERRAALLGTKQGQKKLKEAGFTEEDFERLRSLHISHMRLAKPGKKAAAETAPPAAPEEQDKAALKADTAADAPPETKQDGAAAPAIQAVKKFIVPPVTL